MRNDDDAEDEPRKLQEQHRTLQDRAKVEAGKIQQATPNIVMETVMLRPEQLDNKVFKEISKMTWAGGWSPLHQVSFPQQVCTFLQILVCYIPSIPTFIWMALKMMMAVSSGAFTLRTA